LSGWGIAPEANHEGRLTVEAGKRESMRRSMSLTGVTVTMLVALVAAGCAPQLGTGGSASPKASASTTPWSQGVVPQDDSGMVQQYGAAHADEFAGAYFQQEGGGPLVVLFTGHLDLHQRDLDALLGGPGRAIVKGAVYNEATLQRIMDTVMGKSDDLAAQGINLMSAGEDTIGNRVRVEAKSDDPEAARILEALAPSGAILAVIYPADKPWTQPPSGPGWRLLGNFDQYLPHSLPYTVGFAADEPALATEWQRYELPGAPPAWDPSSEVVIILSDGRGSGCRTMRLDDVVMDSAARLVYGEYSDPLAPRACLADLTGAQTFVVALKRDKLPPSPFTLRIHRQPIGCEPACGFGQAEFQIDLR
jgi:hypothetical protein